MYEYRINWYNSYEDREEYARGLVSADTYTHAMQKVMADYGEPNIIDIYLLALEDTNVIELKTIKEHFELN